MEKSDSFVGSVGTAVLCLCWAVFFIPIASIVRGWALVEVWRLFIVPGFGVDPLPYITALGCSLLLSTWRALPKTADDFEWYTIGPDGKEIKSGTRLRARLHTSRHVSNIAHLVVYPIIVAGAHYLVWLNEQGWFPS